MITISETSLADIKTIQNIANITWPITYGSILSKEQLEYMLDLIYSNEALTTQYQNKKQLFYLIYDEDSVIGFIGIEHHYKDEAVTKIHKIYLLPETQGKGIGKNIIATIEEMAFANKSKVLSLNVNRFNKALNFYQKVGFKVVDEANIKIGNGYLMEDYVMEKNLDNKFEYLQSV